MIECTNQYVWYKKRNRYKFKRFLIILIIISFLVSFFLYYHKVVCTNIFNICSAYITSYNTESVNQAVLKSLETNVVYTDIITIEKNTLDEITLISTNSQKVNKINREVATYSADILKEKLSNGIKIPSFAFTGINILSGYGPIINLKTVSVVNVICEFKSEFKSVGINQTLHSIYIVVKSTVDIEVPFNNDESISETSVLLSETILIGKVPEIYLNGNLFN